MKYTIPLIWALTLVACANSRTGEGDPSIPPPQKPVPAATQPTTTVTPATTCHVTRLEQRKTPVAKIRQSLTKEPFGGLFWGMTADKALELLGAPDKKTPPHEEAATGYVRSDWTYAGKGVTLTVDSSQKVPRVIALDFKDPFTGKNSCGLGIGSPRDTIMKVYGSYLDKDFSKGDNIIAGSVYGGIAFLIKRGRVHSISVGAFAE